MKVHAVYAVLVSSQVIINALALVQTIFMEIKDLGRVNNAHHCAKNV
jgi:hypothetical protein